MKKIKTYIFTVVLLFLNIALLYKLVYPDKNIERKYEKITVEFSPDNRYRIEVSAGEKIYMILFEEDPVMVRYTIYDNLTGYEILEVKELLAMSLEEIRQLNYHFDWQDDYLKISQLNKAEIRMYYNDLR